MPQVKVSVSIEVDGNRVSGSPFIREFQTLEAQGISVAVKNPDGPADPYVELDIDQLDRLGCLFFTADKPIAIRLNNQTTSNIPLLKNGILLLVHGNLTDPTSLASIKNNEVEPANVKYFATELGI